MSLPTESGTISKRDSIASARSRLNERVASQQTYASDPKYKKYTTQVEKCLSTFDNVHEWADFIAFLKQLLKTLQSYQQFKEIPRKLIVAKRLSQCLNPALPAGVHQRALDVYAHILAVIGSDGLKRDLALWSSGLFPFFEYASTSVKPILLNLYDTHYLPLQASLRPVMKAFILALLPGLEEETGEFFDKVLSLLDRLSRTVSPSFLLQNVWLVMLTTPSARGTSLNFLSRRLSQLTANEDITTIVGRDTGLMIRAFAAALEDDNLLVRRGALDLLLTALRIDSPAVVNAQAEDRAILMRAAAGVVLRRDLSLNRRFYTWVLGSDENPQHQADFFQKHSLELLKATLREEMFAPSVEYSEARTFKIFISLLDKWEIGAPLTDALVYDAFKAIRRHVSSQSDGFEDMLMTASTLYEAVEPQILWKLALEAVLSDLTEEGERCEAIQMAKFLLVTFRQDDEMQSLHLPVVFGAILESLKHHVEAERSRLMATNVQQMLSLLDELLKHIPLTALKERSDVGKRSGAEDVPLGPNAFACLYYGIQPLWEETLPRASADQPLVATIEDLLQLIAIGTEYLLDMTVDPSTTQGFLIQTFSILDNVLVPLNEKRDIFVSLQWDPAEWLSLVLGSLAHESVTFFAIDRVVSTVVSLHETRCIEPRLSIDERPVMFKIVSTLLRYLRPDRTIYHLRAVHLIWALEDVTRHPHVEAIIAQSLTSPESRNARGSYEAFGVLWRLTEDSALPGFRLKLPMMIVLDTLKNDNPHLRRIGETWLRCSLRTYLRVLDPLLYDLLDPSIYRSPSMTVINGKELQAFTYERPFDQRYVHHLLETLLSIVHFGGQGFIKTAQNNSVRRAQHTGLISRIDSVLQTSTEVSYMDVLADVILRLLQSEPKPRWAGVMQNFNTSIQSTSIDILQAIVARGELDKLTIQSIEAAVIKKLYSAVHLSRLDLQNKLLHLLHSAISASTVDSEQWSSRPAGTKEGLPDTHPISESAPEPDGATYAVNPLLIQTLVDGISVPTNRPVLQHWLDFILTTVPQFQRVLETAVIPLNDCVCRQLRLALTQVLSAASYKNGELDDISCATTDAEFLMFLNTLERLILLGLSTVLGPGHLAQDSSTGDKATQESTGLLGYMSNVFGSDTVPTGSAEQFTARSHGYNALHQGIRVLYSIWVSFAPSPRATTSRENSLSLIYNRSRARARRVVEHLFRYHSAEVLESIVDCWSREYAERVDAAFELIDVLGNSSQNVVHMVCESISCRIAGTFERSKKQAINSDLSDGTLYTFLEQYLEQLEGPLALQVWPRFLQMAKEVVTNVRDMNAQVFPTLRCMTVLGEKVTQTTAVDDRRMRKDLQETFNKLLDACVSIAGRSFDQGTWMRRTAKDSLAVNGRDSPIPRVVSDTKLSEKLSGSNTSLPETNRPIDGPDLVDQINEYVAAKVLPNLRKFFVENDKIGSACGNIVYYIVAPSMKGRPRPLDVEPAVLAIIQEMSRIPASLKAWRGPVVDAMYDNRFFNSATDSGIEWKSVIRALVDMDKAAFSELLNRISTASSATIFTNREYENLLRSLNLRRLAYVVFAAEKNHFLAQLPMVQEKLVDILRNNPAPILQSEIYLCIRVLLCRLSPHNLTSFWPVVLTELYRLFDQVATSLPSDGSEDLALVLAASKCLDLLLVLQTEEFQIHQWMFITDTVDAIYRPEGWAPEALLDLLAEIAGELPISEADTSQSMLNNVTSTPIAEARPVRRPMLNSVRQIDSIRDLVPFFSSVSIASYESVYASYGNVDWEAVERGLVEDMFDGR